MDNDKEILKELKKINNYLKSLDEWMNYFQEKINEIEKVLILK